jgi:hypothetical protein
MGTINGTSINRAKASQARAKATSFTVIFTSMGMSIPKKIRENRLSQMEWFSELLRSDAIVLQQYNEVRRRIVANHAGICFPVKNAPMAQLSEDGSGVVRDLIYFITSAAAGQVQPAAVFPFAPNQVYPFRAS